MRIKNIKHGNNTENNEAKRCMKKMIIYKRMKKKGHGNEEI